MVVTIAMTDSPPLWDLLIAQAIGQLAEAYRTLEHLVSTLPDSPQTAGPLGLASHAVRVAIISLDECNLYTEVVPQT